MIHRNRRPTKRRCSKNEQIDDHQEMRTIEKTVMMSDNGGQPAAGRCILGELMLLQRPLSARGTAYIGTSGVITNTSPEGYYMFQSERQTNNRRSITVSRPQILTEEPTVRSLHEGLAARVSVHRWKQVSVFVCWDMIHILSWKQEVTHLNLLGNWS